MSIRKMEDGDRVFCDGCYLRWNDDKHGFELGSIEGTLYSGFERDFHWVFPRDTSPHWAFFQYTAKDEPKCPECNEEGLVVSTNDNYWFAECTCHDTPITNTPFEAWDEWKKYCNEHLANTNKTKGK
tara:strand:+ start:67 stop:447 length:381 start_codon:yes stop_codon:yes gene_type:complete